MTLSDSVNGLIQSQQQLQQQQEQLRSFLKQNQAIIPVVVALLALGIALIAYQSKGSQSAPISEDNLQQKNNIPTFLIVGPPNSGKTSLFQYLSYLSNKNADLDDNDKDDVQELKFHELDISATKSFRLNINNNAKLPFQSSYKTKYTLIDVPGEEKIYNLRIKEILDHFQKIQGIVFVIDSTVHNNEINGIAKRLFNLLLLSEKRPNGIDILLAINKTDQFGARPVTKFREILEKEINEIKNLNLRNLKKVNLNSKESNDEHDDEAEQILEEFGNANVQFKFDQLEGNFDFVGGSLYQNKAIDWVNWLDEKAAN